MSSDIITILHLDKDLNGQVVLVKERNGGDSSFIVSSLLGHQVKNKIPTLFITCHNNFMHYQNVGLKMNYNLKRSIQSNLIDYYNLGEEIVNNILNNKKVDLDDIFNVIQEKVSKLKQEYNFVHIVFDGVSHLCDLHYGLKDIVIFVRNISKLVCNCNNSFLFLQINIASDDDVTFLLGNFMSHISYTCVDVLNLQTGLSADVSGHLVIKHPGEKFDIELMSDMGPKALLYHYKLFDKGVKLFAPGNY